MTPIGVQDELLTKEDSRRVYRLWTRQRQTQVEILHTIKGWVYEFTAGNTYRTAHDTPEGALAQAKAYYWQMIRPKW
jgi:hypothetical protein